LYCKYRIYNPFSISSYFPPKLYNVFSRHVSVECDHHQVVLPQFFYYSSLH
jgi:hypothetical protein